MGAGGAKERTWIGLSTLGHRRDIATGRESEILPRSRPALRVGTRLLDERFLIEDILGQGGEGTVFRAYDERRKHSVALKYLHGDYADSLTQLKREFRAAQNLIHPRLVHLHELVVTDEASFFTMELLDGPSFLEEARDRPKLRHLLVQLCDGLAFLHQNGLVHRDVKPSNALLRKNGELVLVDFGVALRLEDDPYLERGPVGTPRYMAPEVLAGEEASEKSDAYSLGILLFEALTGQHPFPKPGEPRNRAAPAPSTLDETIEPLWDSLCEGLLDPEPRRRTSVSELLEQLADRESFPSIRLQRDVGKQTHFLGRDRPLARLGAAYYQVQTGTEPVMALIAGKSGYGKTAFVDEFTNFVEGVVFYGSCSEHELVPHKGFDGIVQNLASYLQPLSREQVLELLPNHDAQHLVPVFPELRVVPCLNELVPTAITEEALRNLRHEAHAALGRVLGRLTQREQLTLVIDDMQWSDLDTVRLLHAVFAKSEAPRCLLILTFRSEEEATSQALLALLSGSSPLVDYVRTLRIDLDPLDAKTASALLDKKLENYSLPRELFDRLLRDCDGCPLLLAELGQQIASDPSAQISGLKDVVEVRKQVLSERGRRAFSLLAAARRLDTTFLSNLVGMGPDELVVELGKARLALSRDGGKTVQVFHDRIREAELDGLGSQADDYHRELAEAYVRVGGEPATIAGHFLSARDATRASIWAERAAHLASRSLALSSAVDLFRLALFGEPEGTERAFSLTDSLAQALADAGHGAEAAPLFAKLADSCGDGAALSYRTYAAGQFLSSGQVGPGWQELKRVSDEAGLTFPETPRDAILQVAKFRTQIWFREKSGTMGSDDSDELAVKLRACRAAWSLSYVSNTHGAANSARYLKLALDSGDPEHLGLAYGMEGLFRATEGTKALEKFVAYRARAEEFLGKSGEPYHRAFLGYVNGQGNYLLGNFADSLAGYETAEQVFVRYCRDVAWELSSARIFWGSSLILTGRHRELDRRLGAWITDAEERGDQYALAALHMYRARRLCLSSFEVNFALEVLSEAQERWQSPYLSVHRAIGALTRIALTLARGDLQEADLTVRKLEEEMGSSMMNRVQVVRLSLEQQRGLVACHRYAVSNASERKALLQSLRLSIRRLRGEDSRVGDAYADHLEGYCLAFSGKPEQALVQLQRAVNRYRDQQMILFAAALRLRIAEALGDSDRNQTFLEVQNAFAQADSLLRQETLAQFAAPLTLWGN